MTDSAVRRLLFDAGDCEGLKEKLVKVISDKELLKKLEKNAFNSLSHDSMNVMVERILEEYNKVL